MGRNVRLFVAAEAVQQCCESNLVNRQLRFDQGAGFQLMQRQFGLAPMSVWTGSAAEGPAVSAPRPYRDFKSGDPLDFYRMLNWVLTENPPPFEDAGALGLFERIGVVPGTEFDPNRLHPGMVDAAVLYEEHR